MNANEAGRLLSKMMNVKLDDEPQEGYSYGMKVEIYYTNPYNMKFDRDVKVHKSIGYFENFNYSQVFIRNENGCLEIINIKLIVSMREIKERI